MTYDLIVIGTGPGGYVCALFQVLQSTALLLDLKLKRRLMRALKGFEAADDLADRSRPIRNGDFEGFRDFLAACGDITAVVCAGPQRAQNLVAVCDRVGVRVPEDLSVVAFDSDYVRESRTRKEMFLSSPRATLSNPLMP